ncbi:lipolysis-stimulated lipoprotein receptor isoform X3 [Grus americana]|uniref:lipolysis-stimulated lipoprotein receptor isoform X3 n=1 Tax=Grus americana TaxID=9117 RepID=UPI002407DFEB|nr:lipolysis-stimulated lipoprotein receptor isoform X3 [Grus americana]
MYPAPPTPAAAIMAAVMAALLALLAPVTPLQVTVTDPRTVALLFQPVLLRCHYQTVALDPPIVTWKYKSFCPTPQGDNGVVTSPGDIPDVTSPCSDATRTVRIVATKQGGVVTLGDFYRGRGVTILGGAELSLGPAAWGDSGVYICTVTSTQDLEGNNEAVAELVVLDWLFVVLVGLGGALGALAVGLCWCQCCPHTCCCLLRCPCCPQRCCCPEALYFAGKAATSGGMVGPYGPSPPPLALRTLASSQSSHVPLLRDNDGSVVSGPPAPSPIVLRYLEEQIDAFKPHGRYPPSRAGPPLSDISSLHEAPDSWVPRGRPPSPPSPPRGRWRSAEFLGGSKGGSPPLSRPRSRSRDDLLGGAEPLPHHPPGPPRRLRKHDALSRESLVV